MKMQQKLKPRKTNKLFIDNKIGTFEVDRESFECMTDQEIEAFKKTFLIVEAKQKFYCDRFEFTAFSELFETQERYMIIRDYKVEVITDEDGNVEFKATKESSF